MQIIITLIVQTLLILIWLIRKSIVSLNMKMLKSQFTILHYIKGMLYLCL